MMNSFKTASLLIAFTVAGCGGSADTPSGPTGGQTQNPPPTSTVVGSVVVSGSAALQAGATTKLTAEVKDASGAVITTVPPVWSSSDQSLISVASDGSVSALRIGTATISATAGGKTGTLDVTSSLTPFTFVFPAGTSAADQTLIKDAVQYGSAFFQTTFGRTITDPTTITGATTVTGCDARAGNAAFTGPGVATFCVGNPGWTNNGPIAKQKITVHELFHVWQFQYKWLGNPNIAGPDWLIEGSAELVGYSGVSAKGLLPIATARGCALKEVSDFNQRTPPGLPPLSAIEAHTAFQTTVGPLYPYSMTAVDELVATPGLLALKTYGDAVGAGTPWQTAFQTSFSTSISAFYAQYPAYRASQTVPPNYLCGV